MTLISLLFASAVAMPPDVGGLEGGSFIPAAGVEDTLVFPGDPDFQAIVNGTETTDFPNVIALAGLANWGSYVWCSGTLVDAYWVVTAAHCIDTIDYVRSIGMTPYIIFGGDLYSNGGATAVTEIREGYIHPNYNGASISNDIGMIELNEAATGVDLAVLNDEPPDNSWLGEDVTAVGYGITSDNGNDGGVKRTTDLTVQYWDSQVIYTYTPGTNLCSGDSGGATFENTAAGTLELAGVNSFVWDGCVGGGAGVVRVDQYISWIQQYAPNVLLGGDGSGSNPGTGGSGGGNASGEPEPDLDPGVVDTEFAAPASPQKGDLPIGFRCNASGVAGGGWGSVWILGLFSLLGRRRTA